MKAVRFAYDNNSYLPYVNVGEPAWRVWRKMKRLNTPYLAVVNGRALVGIVRERDVRLISQIHGGESADVTEIMCSKPFLVHLEGSIRELVDSVISEKLEFVVIVDESHQAIKVISTHNILEYMMKNCSQPNLGNIKNLLENAPDL